MRVSTMAVLVVAVMIATMTAVECAGGCMAAAKLMADCVVVSKAACANHSMLVANDNNDGANPDLITQTHTRRKS